jgi:hypothetical protein
LSRSIGLVIGFVVIEKLYDWQGDLAAPLSPADIDAGGDGLARVAAFAITAGWSSGYHCGHLIICFPIAGRRPNGDRRCRSSGRRPRPANRRHGHLLTLPISLGHCTLILRPVSHSVFHSRRVPHISGFSWQTLPATNICLLETEIIRWPRTRSVVRGRQHRFGR